MNLYIHTSGRATAQEQKTLNALPPALRRRTSLVVQQKQAKLYQPIAKDAKVNLVVLPRGITKLSPTRQWILENAPWKFVMLDDDLTFFKRRTDAPGKFVRLDADGVGEMFAAIEAELKTRIHATILMRDGANYITDHKRYAGRAAAVLAYDGDKVRKTGARFDRVPAKQDFDMTLQLLRAGHENAILCDYIFEPGRSNAPGGCSVYRDDTVNELASNKLAALHPGFVQVVVKEAKFNYVGATKRTDVRVAWKKAYQSSQVKA